MVVSGSTVVTIRASDERRICHSCSPECRASHWDPMHKDSCSHYIAVSNDCPENLKLTLNVQIVMTTKLMRNAKKIERWQRYNGI